MKILEAQSATLTNYEVYIHLTDMQHEWDRKRANVTAEKKKMEVAQSKLPKRFADQMEIPVVPRRPGNLETISSQLLQYFREAPSPLGSKPFPYHPSTITDLLVALRPWDFTKAEVIMILNLRPTKPESLNTIVEQMEDRFPGDEVQLEICKVIGDVLGRSDGQAERQAMTDNAAVARKEVKEQPAEDMEVDTPEE